MSTYDKFLNPSREYTTVPFWFWNGKLEFEEITRQLKLMAEQKIYQCVIHARNGLLTPYLSEDWFECIAHTLKEGKRLGIKFWIYDENNWPSGYAGGRVIKENSDYCGKHIAMREYKAEENADLNDAICTVAVFYKNGDKWIKGDNPHTPVDRRIFTEHYTHWKVAYGSEDYIDLLNFEATNAFMEYTHFEYEKRFKNEFGNQILGFFSDEAGFYNNLKLPWSDRSDDGTLVWNERLPEYFSSKNGYDICEQLLYLFEYDKDISPKLRHDFFQTVSEMYRECFLRPQKEFCEKYNMKFIGHLHYEDYMHLQIATQGNFFGALSEFSYAGCDRIEYNYGAFTEKVTSSVSHQYNKARTLSETYAQGGWDFSMQDMRFWADYQLVRGINLFVVHAFFYSVEDFRKNDAPPSYFFQSPVYYQYGYFSDYIMRMCQLMAEGKTEIRLAVYYPTTAAQVLFDTKDQERVRSLDRDIQAVVSGLEKSHYEFNLVDDDGLSEQLEANGYKALVVLAHWLPLKSFENIYKLAKKSIPIVFLRHLPKCVEKEFREEYISRLKEIIELNNVKYIDEYHFYCNYNYDFDTQQLKEFYPFSKAIKPLIELEDKKSDIKCTVRRFDDATVYFLVNEGSSQVNTIASFDEKDVPVIWNATDGSSQLCDCTYENRQTKVEIDILGYSSKLYVFSHKKEFGVKSEKNERFILDKAWEISYNNESFRSPLKKISDVKARQVKYEYLLNISTKPKEAYLWITDLHNTCSVEINGEKAGDILWKPYCLKTNLFKSGKNTIKITVNTTCAVVNGEKSRAFGIAGPVWIDAEF